MSGAIVFISNALNSCFGWLYNSSEPSKSIQANFDVHKDKVLSFIDNVNTEYNNLISTHPDHEYGFDDTGSEFSIRSDTYRDILTILVVQKQKLYGDNGNIDPNGIYDLFDLMNFKDNEIKEILNMFYSMSTRSGTYICSGCECDGHNGSHSFPSCYTLNCTQNHTHTSACYSLSCNSSHKWYCSGCKCDGHSALYVKIVNHSKESVMSALDFTSDEIERVATISNILADIKSGLY